MYKIGQFARLTNLSIRTLRYYNEIGLLIPEEVDIYSSYRYYGERNLKEAQLIEQYKKAGFTLDEIKENWMKFNETIYLKKKEELYQERFQIEGKIKQLDYLREHTESGVLLEENQQKKGKRLC